MDSKLLLSQIYSDYFRKLYDSFCGEIEFDDSFEKVFKNNTSRLKFLNTIYDYLNENKLSDDFVNLFNESIGAISNYIDGSFECGIAVPSSFRNDIEGCYIPTERELRFLFGLMKICCDFHATIYDGKEFSLLLPEGTLDQNITKLFSIKKENLPHILGLTEHEDKGNYLFNYFLKKDVLENPKLYTTEKGQPLSNGQKVSERYLDWILSVDGQEEIIHINQCIRFLMQEDMKRNPQSYTNGQPKSKNRFAELVYETYGIRFPMIKFSRYICKTVNLLNFLNMNNTSEMILDYNAQIGEAIPQDMFFVNAASSDLLDNSSEYLKIKKIIYELLEKYDSDDETVKREAADALRTLGINVHVGGKDSIVSWANLLRTYEFVGSKGIEPTLSSTKQSLLSSLSALFSNDVHLLGFGSTINGKDESGQITRKLFGTDESVTDRTYCGTSIAVTVPEYLDKFNVRGRCFFLDNFAEPEGVGEGPFYVGTPSEEIEFARIIGEKSRGDSGPNAIEFFNKELRNLYYCFTQGYTYEPKDYDNGISSFKKK